MRKSWIALAMVAVLVGLVGAYRVGRPENPPRGPAPPVRESEARPERPPAREEAPASRRAVPSVSELSRGDDTPASRTGADEQRPIATMRSTSSAPHVAASPPTVPAPAENAPSPIAPAHVEPVSPPPVPPAGTPVPHAAAPPATTAAPSEEPAKRDEPTAAEDDKESDRRPPVLESLRFDPPEIKDGGVAMLSVAATDDLSGVKLVSGTVRSPSEAAVVPFTAQDVAGTGVFTAAIAIPHKAETGDWFVDALRIADKADNLLTLAFTRPDVPQGGSLRVVSAESDSTAPNVHDVSMDKGQLNPGETDHVVVDVDDDGSGVASVTGAFQNPSKSAFIPFTCRPNGGTSWAADVPVPANADCGEWTLRHLRVADNAGNSAELSTNDPQVGGVGFFVTSSGPCDSEPPIIDAMEFSPAVVSNTAAAEIVLTVRAHDDGSGVATLFGRIEGPAAASGQVPWILFDCSPDPKDPEAPMTAKISVPQYAARGIWSVVWVQVTDKARNTHPYYRSDPVLGGASFVVE